jgi:hypothetical protein
VGFVQEAKKEKEKKEMKNSFMHDSEDAGEKERGEKEIVCFVAAIHALTRPICMRVAGMVEVEVVWV